MSIQKANTTAYALPVPLKGFLNQYMYPQESNVSSKHWVKTENKSYQFLTR